MIAGLTAHVWQSTLFAGAAWVAALLLRANRAHVRYWVWFAASLKFLLPFSLLIGFGALIPQRPAGPPARTEWIDALRELTRPLALPGAVVNHKVSSATESGYLWAIATALWALGFVIVITCWLLRWRRVQALLKHARPLQVPTRFEIRAPVMSVPDLIEPGVFGILRPVLLLPEGLAGQLSQEQFDAVLAHELCHLRRRDNLTAAIHMGVQAVFWFHPIPWWIGARLVNERERACDEDVLRLGCKANVYAESILLICKSYVRSPLACVPGVAGSDLKRRIEGIMRNRETVGLSLGKKLGLGIAATAVVGIPIVLGTLTAPAVRAQGAPEWQTEAAGKVSFEVASVKQSPPIEPGRAWALEMMAGSPFGRLPGTGNRVTIEGWSAAELVAVAYQIPMREIVGPSWISDARYVIDALIPSGQPRSKAPEMLRTLLEDRFALKAHPEVRRMSGYMLSVGRDGPKLKETGPPTPTADLSKLSKNQIRPGFNGDQLDHGSMAQLADHLAMRLHAPVQDQTGLKGFFFILIEIPSSEMKEESDRFSLYRNGLRGYGLNLAADKIDVPVLVIDNLARTPASN